MDIGIMQHNDRLTAVMLHSTEDRKQMKAYDIESHETNNIKKAMKGKTIVNVKVETDNIKILFDDCTMLEIYSTLSGYDETELSYTLEIPE